jgi:hypothetical protein
MASALAMLAALAGVSSRASQRASASPASASGFGMVTQVLVVVVQNSVDRRQLGIATATTGFFRVLPGARRGRRRIGARGGVRRPRRSRSLGAGDRGRGQLHRHAYDEIFRRRRDGHDGGAPEPEEVDAAAKRSADYRPPGS